MFDNEKKINKIIIKKKSLEETKKSVGFKLKHPKKKDVQEKEYNFVKSSSPNSRSTSDTNKEKKYTQPFRSGNRNFGNRDSRPPRSINTRNQNDKTGNTSNKNYRPPNSQDRKNSFTNPQPKDILNKIPRAHTHLKKKKYDKSAVSNEKEFQFIRNVKPDAVIPEKITIGETLLVKELAALMNIKVGTLIEKLLRLGYKATLNDAIDSDTAEILASEFNCQVIVESLSGDLEKLLDTHSTKATVVHRRAPIVTVMGHVDHGKTSLLDYLRKTQVTAEESGGITQHIGAYQVSFSDNHIITFIDTPGHEAFSQMRERGASITDIIILVVSLDDGVKPQTIEAIKHAKNWHTPMIVAMNKVDKAPNKIDTLKQQLSEHEVMPEEWGGDTFFIPISAITGQGVDELLECINIVAQLIDLEVPIDKNAVGFILESQLKKSRGICATVLIKEGNLKKGDIFVSGEHSGKVRILFDHLGNQIKEAKPSTPVEVIGFETLPTVGNMFWIAPNEKVAKSVVSKQKQIIHRDHLAKRVLKNETTLDDLYSDFQNQNRTELNLIIKSDAQGTNEAIQKLIDQFSSKIEEIKIKIIHLGVGSVNESDVQLAETSKAIIIGFNVRPNNYQTMALLHEKKIELKKFNIIYKLMEDLYITVENLLAPEKKEISLGTAEVKAIYKNSKFGFIAGVMVTQGLIKLNSLVRVIRNNKTICKGTINTLKRVKEDVKEMQKGFECGLTIKGCKDFQENDQLEVFEVKEFKRTLNID